MWPSSLLSLTAPERPFGGITSFLLDCALPGYRVAQKFEKMGLRTSPMGELVFEDMFVSKDAVLGGVGGGSKLFIHSMDWERACLFAGHVGTMERLMEKVVAYARTRRQSGQAISKHQAVAHKIADMKMHVEAAQLLAYKAAWGLERSEFVSLDAAVSKLFVAKIASSHDTRRRPGLRRLWLLERIRCRTCRARCHRQQALFRDFGDATRHHCWLAGTLMTAGVRNPVR